MQVKIIKKKVYGSGEILSPNQVVDIFRRSKKWVVKSRHTNLYLGLEREDFVEIH